MTTPTTRMREITGTTTLRNIFFFVLPWLVSIPDFYKKEKYERKRKITMMQTETWLCLCGEVEDEEGTWAELL
jgi:hypothetical protein